MRLRALRDAPDAFGSTLEREEAFDESEWRRRVAPSPTWIATTGDVDVGIVSGGRHDHTDVPWVYAMWVDPVARGTGIAEQLLDEVVGWARASGASALGLDVTDRMVRARRFYERFGFVASGETLPLPRDPTIQLIVMHLDLTTRRDPSTW